MANYCWTMPEIKALVNNYPTKGLDYVHTLLPHRTRAAIARKAAALKLKLIPEQRGSKTVKKINKNVWTAEEFNIIMEHKAVKTARELLQLLPNRSLLALRHFLAREKIKVLHEQAWRPDEVAFLKKKYSELGAVGCAQFINRTPIAIQTKAAELGLKVSATTLSLINSKKGRPKTPDKGKQEVDTSRFKSAFHRKANEILERHWKGERFEKGSPEYRIGKTMGIINY